MHQDQCKYRRILCNHKMSLTIVLGIGVKYSCFKFKMEENITLLGNFSLWCNVLYYVMLGIE